MPRTAKKQEETAEAPVTEEEIRVVETMSAEEYAICNDPFLTDEQKEYLFKYEFDKMITNAYVSDANTGKFTLIRFEVSNIQRETRNILLNACGDGLKKAWEFYKRHMKNPTVDGYLAEVRKSLGESLAYKDVFELKLD